MRKSTFFILYITLNVILLFVIFIHASFTRKAGMEFVREKTEIVRKLQLTDLCLFTEASYIRHLSQADLHTAFQDSPMSLEHFPSGSLVPPPQTISPERIRKMNGKVD
ncbi:MAG: hypothetical protein WCO26_05655 [Deltaproteobacteria bacterium]